MQLAGILLFLISSATHGDMADIVFPDDRVEKQFNLSVPVSTSSEYKVRNIQNFIPTGCDDDYCEDSDEYPDVESVKEIVKNFGNPDFTQLLFTQIGVTDPLKIKNRAPVPIPYESFDSVNSRLNPKIVGTILTESSTAQIPYSQPREPWDENDLISETPLCHTIENYVFPKTAKTRKRQWR